MEEINKKIHCQKVGERYYLFYDGVPKMVTDEIGFIIITDLQSGKTYREIEQHLKKCFVYHGEDIYQDIVDFVEEINKVHV